MNPIRSTIGSKFLFMSLVLGMGDWAIALGGPCDIYQAAGTPCVAAYSMVRALYSSYSGNLYQVRRASDKTTKNIGVPVVGGFVKSIDQDSFCVNTTCTISYIYDQSPQKNDLPLSPPVLWLPNGGIEASATMGKAKVGGHTVYGVYIQEGVGNSYRNNQTKGVATGDQAESIYMVADGTHFNTRCCFDYGNVETTGKDDGPGTMEALNFGTIPNWSEGSGSGPWVMVDLENGVYAGSQLTGSVASNTSLVASYVTVMFKGPSGNHMTLKGGNAAAGPLAIKYDGARPAGYSPMKKEGAVELGTGGDGSGGGDGTFFEGALISGVPTDAIDDSIQANIVAAGFGSSVSGISTETDPKIFPMHWVYDYANATGKIAYELSSSSQVRVRVMDLRGKEVARLVDGMVAPGLHEARWNAGRMRFGIYAMVLEINGNKACSEIVPAGR